MIALLFLFWCRHQESNSGPSDYKSAALPTELYRQRGRIMRNLAQFDKDIMGLFDHRITPY